MEKEKEVTIGQWETVFESQVVGIHSALLNDGNVLLFSYMSNNSVHSHTDDQSHSHSHGSADSIGDSETVNVITKTSKRIYLQRNIFCGGTCFLDDGRLFVAGGQYPTFYKIFNSPCKDINTFDPVNGKWNYVSKESGLRMKGRWYPSCTNLADGKTMIISGRYSFYQTHFWIFNYFSYEKLYAIFAASHSVHCYLHGFEYPVLKDEIN